MPKSRARRYSVEIKDAKGVVLFSTIAYWDDQDRRIALAQITRLAGLPEVNFHTELALEPEHAEHARARRVRIHQPRAGCAPPQHVPDQA